MFHYNRKLDYFSGIFVSILRIIDRNQNFKDLNRIITELSSQIYKLIIAFYHIEEYGITVNPGIIKVYIAMYDMLETYLMRFNGQKELMIHIEDRPINNLADNETVPMNSELSFIIKIEGLKKELAEEFFFGTASFKAKVEFYKDDFFEGSAVKRERLNSPNTSKKNMPLLNPKHDYLEKSILNYSYDKSAQLDHSDNNPSSSQKNVKKKMIQYLGVPFFKENENQQNLSKGEMIGKSTITGRLKPSKFNPAQAGRYESNSSSDSDEEKQEKFKAKLMTFVEKLGPKSIKLLADLLKNKDNELLIREPKFFACAFRLKTLLSDSTISFKDILIILYTFKKRTKQTGLLGLEINGEMFFKKLLEVTLVHFELGKKKVIRKQALASNNPFNTVSVFDRPEFKQKYFSQYVTRLCQTFPSEAIFNSNLAVIFSCAGCPKDKEISDSYRFLIENLLVQEYKRKSSTKLLKLCITFIEENHPAFQNIVETLHRHFLELVFNKYRQLSIEEILQLCQFLFLSFGKMSVNSLELVHRSQNHFGVLLDDILNFFNFKINYFLTNIPFHKSPMGFWLTTEGSKGPSLQKDRRVKITIFGKAFYVQHSNFGIQNVSFKTNALLFYLAHYFSLHLLHATIIKLLIDYWIKVHTKVNEIESYLSKVPMKLFRLASNCLESVEALQPNSLASILEKELLISINKLIKANFDIGTIDESHSFLRISERMITHIYEDYKIPMASEEDTALVETYQEIAQKADPNKKYEQTSALLTKRQLNLKAQAPKGHQLHFQLNSKRSSKQALGLHGSGALVVSNKVCRYIFLRNKSWFCKIISHVYDSFQSNQKYFENEEYLIAYLYNLKDVETEVELLESKRNSKNLLYKKQEKLLYVIGRTMEKLLFKQSRVTLNAEFARQEYLNMLKSLWDKIGSITHKNFETRSDLPLKSDDDDGQTEAEKMIARNGEFTRKQAARKRASVKGTIFQIYSKEDWQSDLKATFRSLIEKKNFGIEENSGIYKNLRITKYKALSKESLACNALTRLFKILPFSKAPTKSQLFSFVAIFFDSTFLSENLMITQKYSDHFKKFEIIRLQYKTNQLEVLFKPPKRLSFEAFQSILINNQRNVFSRNMLNSLSLDRIIEVSTSLKLSSIKWGVLAQTQFILKQLCLPLLILLDNLFIVQGNQIAFFQYLILALCIFLLMTNFRKFKFYDSDFKFYMLITQVLVRLYQSSFPAFIIVMYSIDLSYEISLGASFCLMASFFTLNSSRLFFLFKSVAFLVFTLMIISLIISFAYVVDALKTQGEMVSLSVIFTRALCQLFQNTPVTSHWRNSRRPFPGS